MLHCHVVVMVIVRGGAIRSDAPLTIANSQFTVNEARVCGGIYIDNTRYYSATNITNCTFFGNMARLAIGPIRIKTLGPAYLHNLDFRCNMIAAFGGYESSPHLIACDSAIYASEIAACGNGRSWFETGDHYYDMLVSPACKVCSRMFHDDILDRYINVLSLV